MSRRAPAELVRLQRGFQLPNRLRAILSIEVFNVFDAANVEVGSGNMTYGPGTVAQVVGISLATNWLGYGLLAGCLFASGALTLPPQAELGHDAVRLMGALMVLLSLGYVAACAIQHGRVWLIGCRPPWCGFLHGPGRVTVHYSLGRVGPLTCGNAGLPFSYHGYRISLTCRFVNTCQLGA